VSTLLLADHVRRLDAIETWMKQVDTSMLVPLHTLGTARHQAATGDHEHDVNELRDAIKPILLSGVTLTGSRGGNAAVASIIAALVSLGATDGTTP